MRYGKSVPRIRVCAVQGGVVRVDIDIDISREYCPSNSLELTWRISRREMRAHPSVAEDLLKLPKFLDVFLDVNVCYVLKRVQIS